MTQRNFEPEHRIDMYQARCTNCGVIEDDYGAFDDVSSCIESLECNSIPWFARYRYEDAPTPEMPQRQIAHIEELLCPRCQTCEVCDVDRAYPSPNDSEHLVCADHEDHDFSVGKD